MATIPAAWTDLVSAHRRATVARDAMRARGGSQQIYDQNMEDFARGLDDMFDAMERLGETDTSRITALLASKERA